MMSDLAEHSIPRDLTRGGQTFLHKVRMLSQIILRLVLLICFIFLLVSSIVFVMRTSSNLRSSLVKIAEARLYVDFAPQHKIKLREQQVVTSDWLLKHIYTRRLLKHARIIALGSMLWGAIFAFISGVITITWLIRQGRTETKAKLLKGTKIIAPHKLKKQLVKLGIASDLEIGGVPIPKGSETTHTLIHGTVGTGKSVCMQALMDQIRRRGNKAIIYDKHGDYVKYFFREGKDILLNPLDARCAPWDLWRECDHPANFDSLAAGLIPLAQSSNDPFWISAARTIFSATAYKMQSDPERSNEKLLKYLLMSDLDSIADLLKGTEAESLVSDKIAKTALSVKTVLATYLNPLKFLPKVGDQYFSIREWIQDESNDSWLFITSRSDMHETLKPLISAWLDIAANALMSLPENRDRRVWMMLDELASLQRLPTLPHAFAESRKFGGCLVAAVQNFSQLKKIYGQDGGEEISDLCNIRVYFRSPSTETARWVSRELGQNDLLESNEGLSYGANTHRDGVSLSRQLRMRPVVSEHDIKSLENLSAYLKIPPTYTYKRLNNILISLVNFNTLNFKLIATPWVSEKQVKFNAINSDNSDVLKKNNKNEFEENYGKNMMYDLFKY